MNEQLEIDFSVVEKEIAKIIKKPKNHKSTVENDLRAFKAVLNKKPTDVMLKKNSFYGNMYIPQEIIERMLSALYLSYNFVITTPPIIAEGNIIFMIDVILKHPVTGSVETFSGVSAVPIMPVNGTIRDIHPHIPAAKTFAIMNACKHIGRLFRAENDDITKVFDTYFEDKEEKPELSVVEKEKLEEKERLLEMINNKKNKESLIKLSKAVRDLDDISVSIEYGNKHREFFFNKK